MPRIPEKFEDWTPAWAEGEFDEDKAKRQVFNALLAEQKAKATIAKLREEQDESAEKLAAAEEKLARNPKADDAAKDAEITALKGQVRKLEKDGRPEDSAQIQRLTVAMDHGLTAKDAARLVGATPEELADDAADLAERLGIGKANDDGKSGNGAGDQGKPPSQRPGSLGNGRQRDGEAPQLLTAAELIKQESAPAAGLQLAPLR